MLSAWANFDIVSHCCNHASDYSRFMAIHCHGKKVKCWTDFLKQWGNGKETLPRLECQEQYGKDMRTKLWNT